MDELQIKDEQPLLVVKYVWWRVLYTQVAYSFAVGIGYMGYFVLSDCSIIKCPIALLLLMVGLFGIHGFLELLFFKELRFYFNRLEKSYYFFGIKYIDFHNKELRRFGTLLDFFIFISNNSFFDRRITIPIHLLGRQYLQVVSILALVSGRTAQQIEEIGLYGKHLNPFLIKKIQ